MSSGFVFHPEAEADLVQIWDYIAADNLRAADQWMADIHDALNNLVIFPEQGFRRPNLTNRPLRFLVVHDYLIAYVPAGKPVWIVAIMHGKRSPRTMESILRGRDES